MEKKKSRIQLRTLQLPRDRGGLAVPHPWCYFLASQLQHLKGCNDLSEQNPGRGMLLLGTCHDTLTEALKADSFSLKFSTLLLIKKLWKVVKEIL